MSGKLYIAAAGSGKTRKIIQDSLNTNKRVLILTYTIANEKEIINRIKEKSGIIPKNITVSTWFSFLLKDGIRPYQGSRFKDRIEGIIPVNGQGNKYVSKKYNSYFAIDNKIYTNKLSECVIELNNKCKGKVFERIAKMYDYIYIDEVQDMVGYDLEIIKCLIASKIEIIMLGDPRQCTYSTHSEKKYKKYSFGKINEFLKNECKGLDIEIDESTLNCTYRNNNLICEFANSLYPDMPEVGFVNLADDSEKGVKLINKKDLDLYLKTSKAVQLRYDKRTKVNEEYLCYNFGESKGLEFKNVLIYPTNNIWDWIIDNSTELKGRIRAKFYVAVTRAIDSVVIVKKDNKECNLPTIKF